MANTTSLSAPCSGMKTEGSRRTAVDAAVQGVSFDHRFGQPPKRIEEDTAPAGPELDRVAEVGRPKVEDHQVARAHGRRHDLALSVAADSLRAAAEADAAGVLGVILEIPGEVNDAVVTAPVGAVWVALHVVGAVLVPAAVDRAEMHGALVQIHDRIAHELARDGEGRGLGKKSADRGDRAAGIEEDLTTAHGDRATSVRRAGPIGGRPRGPLRGSRVRPGNRRARTVRCRASAVAYPTHRFVDGVVEVPRGHEAGRPEAARVERETFAQEPHTVHRQWRRDSEPRTRPLERQRDRARHRHGHVKEPRGHTERARDAAHEVAPCHRCPVVDEVGAGGDQTVRRTDDGVDQVLHEDPRPSWSPIAHEEEAPPHDLANDVLNVVGAGVRTVDAWRTEDDGLRANLAKTCRSPSSFVRP